MTTPNSLDGRLAQGWGGTNPDGVHVNVLLAERGSPTAAAMTSAFSSPTTGFTPILVCVGPDQPSYQTVHPPTIMLNKVAPDTDRQSALVSGACQLGIAQAVLDLVAEHLLSADQHTLVFVSVWLDPEAGNEDAVRAAAREATAAALREAINGSEPSAAADLVTHRDQLRHPFFGR